METPKITSTESLYERDVRYERDMRSFERRLLRVEDKTDEILGLAGLGLIPLLGRLLNRLFMPRLWRYQQYASRRPRIPKQYFAETAVEPLLRFAIVTPSLNQAPFIKATIDSVLQQNYPKLAYLVQDGGSGEETIDILKSYGASIQWRSEVDSGQANAINRGFKRIEGDIMAYLNSDDVLLPGTLAYVARFFEENPDVDVVYGHRIYIDADGLEVGRCVLPPHDTEVLKWADYIPQETSFWRRRVWEAVGPIDETFSFALDWDFLLRSQRAGFCFKRLPRFLACFRVHDDQKNASMMQTGLREMRRIRVENLGSLPGTYDVRQAIKGYLFRQACCDLMYRLRLLRY
jgi:glycosyltransferase involved in cell wall biosynthesis